MALIIIAAVMLVLTFLGFCKSLLCPNLDAEFLIGVLIYVLTCYYSVLNFWHAAPCVYVSEIYHVPLTVT